MAFTATTEPTAYGNMIGPSGYDSWYDGIVLSYAVSSAVSISKGDFVKLADTGSNSIAKCNSSVNDTQFIGIAVGDLDNSAGTSASATSVGILRKGIAMVDILIGSNSKVMDDTVFFDELLYLSMTADGVSTVTIGQALTATATGVPIARSIDHIHVPTASTLFKGRVYIDRLTKELMVE